MGKQVAEERPFLLQPKPRAAQPPDTGMADRPAPAFPVLLPGARAVNAAKETGKALILFASGAARSPKDDPLTLIRAEIADRHPDLAIRAAYSPAHAQSALKSRGEDAPGLIRVLADLCVSGHTRIAVQSLHVIPGLAFDAAREIAGRGHRLPQRVERITLGRPLIGSHQYAEAAAAVLARALPEDRKAGEAVVLVGHGAASPAGSLAYPALQCFLTRLDPEIFVGTIAGPFTPEATLAALRAAGFRKAWLVPLLTVVGYHAAGGLFGDSSDSWRQILSRAGIEAIPVFRGLAAVPALVSLWADHADLALAELDAAP